MSETTERVSEILRSRLQEIEAEARRLEGALASVGGRARRTRGTANKPSGGTAQGAGAGGRRKRAAPGERQAQLLEAIKRHPTAGATGLAQTIGVKPPQVHALLAKLRAERLISRQGKGYSVKAGASRSTDKSRRAA